MTLLRRTAAGAGPGRHRNGLRNRAGDQHGAIIVIVAVLLTVVMASGALAIDLSSARQSETKAQSTADAAATAAANMIPLAALTDPTYTPTPAESGQVTSSAQAIAIQNGACQTCVTVQYPYKGSDYSRVMVTVSAVSQGTLGAEVGHPNLPVSASAVALARTTTAVETTPTSSLSTSLSTSVSNSVTTSLTTSVSNSISTTVTKTTSTIVTPPSNATPSAIFAYDSTCGDTPLTIGNSLSGTDAANNVNLQGSIYSNGNIGLYYTNGNFGATISYGPKCSIQGNTNGNYNGGHPVAAAAVYPYPHDYSKDTISCDHSAPTFSWSGTDENLSGGGTYCATSSITINLTNNLNASGVTFVAPKISITASNCNLSPDPGAPGDLEIYNKGSSSQTLSINCPSNLNFGGGAIFSPNAPIDISSQNFNDSEFIEGYQVHLAVGSINVSGDGAASGPGSSPTTTTTTYNVTNTTTTPVTSTTTNTTTTPITVTSTSTLTNSYTVTNTSTKTNGSGLAAP